MHKPAFLLSIAALLISAPGASTPADAPVDRDAAAPRTTAETFIGKLLSAEFEAAAALRPQPSGTQTLEKIRESIGSDEIHIAELYRATSLANDEVAFVVTSGFPYTRDPEETVYLYLRLRFDGEQWRVHDAQIEDWSAVRRLRRQFFEKYRNARVDGAESWSIPIWTGEEFVKRLTSGQTAEAGALASRCLDKNALDAFRDLSAIEALRVDEFYLDRTEVLAISQRFPLKLRQEMAAHLAVHLRKKGEAWHVEKVQLYDSATISNARRTFLIAHPNAMVNVGDAESP